MIKTPGFALDYETNPVCTSDNQMPAMDEVSRMSLVLNKVIESMALHLSFARRQYLITE